MATTSPGVPTLWAEFAGKYMRSARSRTSPIIGADQAQLAVSLTSARTSFTSTSDGGSYHSGEGTSRTHSQIPTSPRASGCINETDGRSRRCSRLPIGTKQGAAYEWPPARHHPVRAGELVHSIWWATNCILDPTNAGPAQAHWFWIRCFFFT